MSKEAPKTNIELEALLYRESLFMRMELCKATIEPGDRFNEEGTEPRKIDLTIDVGGGGILVEDVKTFRTVRITAEELISAAIRCFENWDELAPALSNEGANS